MVLRTDWKLAVNTQYTGLAKKVKPQTRGHNSVKSQPIFNFFSTRRFLGKFAVKSLLKIPPYPCICCHTTLWNINVKKQAINDLLQGCVATYLTRGNVVNNQIKKGLLLSLRVNFFKSVNIWQSYEQERDCFVHFFRFLAVCWPSAQVRETITFLFVTLPNIHRFWKKIHLQIRQ